MTEWSYDSSLSCDEQLDDRSWSSSPPQRTDPSSNQTTSTSEAQLALHERDVNECYRSMLLHERTRRPNFATVYPYVKYRRILVDWMNEVGESMQIRKTTVHTAITFLERCLIADRQRTKDKYQLLALSCLMIAAKYLGPEDAVPSVGEIWELGNGAYSVADVHSTELDTLELLNWSLTALAPVHFVRYFLSHQVLFEDDEIQGFEMVDHALEHYEKFTDFFVDICMQEYDFQSFRPSLVASGILATSRKALGVTPLWREELSVLTGYNAEQVEPCFSCIWDYYVLHFGDKSSATEVSPTGVCEIPPRLR